MDAIRFMTNLRVPDIDGAKGFYTDYLGMRTEEFNLGWVARYTSDDRRSIVQLGYEIVYPLTVEAWGVHRFFVRAPDGNVFNIVAHAH